MTMENLNETATSVDVTSFSTVLPPPERDYDVQDLLGAMERLLCEMKIRAPFDPNSIHRRCDKHEDRM